MYEWEAKLSDIKKDEKRISLSVYTATVIADSEEEARKILAEEEPDLHVDSIQRIDA